MTSARSGDEKTFGSATLGSMYTVPIWTALSCVASGAISEFTGGSGLRYLALGLLVRGFQRRRSRRVFGRDAQGPRMLA
jgi:hypothetical protein